MNPSDSSRSSADTSDAERLSSPEKDASSHRIVILGGGEAGLAVLDALADHALIAEVALIEPSTYDYNQPEWMRVGTEGLQKEQTRASIEPRIPPEVTWVQDQVTGIDPQNQIIRMDRGSPLQYDYLVVALGTGVHWDRIRNLKEHLGTQGICSVYGYEQAEHTWEMIRTFQGGRAIFTNPSTPHKGGSAPFTLLRRAEEVWQDAGVRSQTELVYATAASSGPPEATPHTHVYTGYDLIDVRPERTEAIFNVTKGRSQSRDVLTYDLLHVVPPMRPPALIQESGLAHRDGPMTGYLAVDPESFRHPRFERVFGIGDVIGVEGVKTGERAREQAESVARTLRRIAGTDA
jgi:sulfide:quinone oxidoreductase